MRDDSPDSQPELTKSHLRTLRKDVDAGIEQIKAGKVSPFDEVASARIKANGRKLMRNLPRLF
jgi:hypothetical protein